MGSSPESRVKAKRVADPREDLFLLLDLTHNENYFISATKSLLSSEK